MMSNLPELASPEQ